VTVVTTKKDQGAVVLRVSRLHCRVAVWRAARPLARFHLPERLLVRSITAKSSRKAQTAIRNCHAGDIAQVLQGTLSPGIGSPKGSAPNFKAHPEYL
jgi:hypothetical protein